MGSAYKYEFSIELPHRSDLPQEPEGLTIGSVLAGVTENLRRPISELRWLDASIHEKLFLVERMSARRGLYVPNDIRSFLFEQGSISWDEKRRVVEERLERYARPYGNGELEVEKEGRTNNRNLNSIIQLDRLQIRRSGVRRHCSGLCMINKRFKG